MKILVISILCAVMWSKVFGNETIMAIHPESNMTTTLETNITLPILNMSENSDEHQLTSFEKFLTFTNIFIRFAIILLCVGMTIYFLLEAAQNCLTNRSNRGNEENGSQHAEINNLEPVLSDARMDIYSNFGTSTLERELADIINENMREICSTPQKVDIAVGTDDLDATAKTSEEIVCMDVEKLEDKKANKTIVPPPEIEILPGFNPNIGVKKSNIPKFEKTIKKPTNSTVKRIVTKSISSSSTENDSDSTLTPYNNTDKLSSEVSTSRTSRTDVDETICDEIKTSKTTEEATATDTEIKKTDNETKNKSTHISHTNETKPSAKKTKNAPSKPPRRMTVSFSKANDKKEPTVKLPVDRVFKKSPVPVYPADYHSATISEIRIEQVSTLEHKSVNCYALSVPETKQEKATDNNHVAITMSVEDKLDEEEVSHV